MSEQQVLPSVVQLQTILIFLLTPGEDNALLGPCKDSTHFVVSQGYILW